MSDQLPKFVPNYSTLPPVAVSDDALLRFFEEMDRRLVEFDDRFYQPRRHPRIEARRHRNQPPRKPR